MSVVNLQQEIECWSFMKKIPFNLNFHNSSILYEVHILRLQIQLIPFLDREYQLTFLNPKRDASATLNKYEERQYDHIVLFPQKLKGMNPLVGKILTVSHGIEFNSAIICSIP